jgi:NAD(P)H-nitrite reductase large subunit
MGHHHGSADSTDPGDREVCVCFHVRRRKVESWCRREKPRVVSLVSQCLSAGTGCGWCIPFLKAIHHEIVEGGPPADIPTEEEYLDRRAAYHEEQRQKRKGAASDSDPNPSSVRGRD